MVDLFTTYDIPEIVHSDQGRNFESAIFQPVLKAFGVRKTRTTAYHPQGDGMVERFNHTLLQLLRTYVTRLLAVKLKIDGEVLLGSCLALI